MLQTQVNYWDLREKQRHNIVTEWQNLADLKRKQDELDQLVDYRAKEVQYWQNQLRELNRHNVATENLTDKEIATKVTQAKAALKQANAAYKNAVTNRKELKIKQQNANANTRSSKASMKTAKANAKNASTNRRKLYKVDIPNVKVNKKNASTARRRLYKVEIPSVRIDRKNANTNRKNANTNRMKLTKVDIPRLKRVDIPNAISNRITANAAKQNADTNVNKLAIDWANVDISKQNATTNRMNANTNQRNAVLRAEEIRNQYGVQAADMFLKRAQAAKTQAELDKIEKEIKWYFVEHVWTAGTQGVSNLGKTYRYIKGNPKPEKKGGGR